MGQPDLDGFMALMERVNLNGPRQHTRSVLVHMAGTIVNPDQVREQSYEHGVNSP